MNGYTNGNNSERCGERAALMQQIRAYSFGMDDLRLFIDTHENAHDAIELFNQYADERGELIARYSEAYGPIEGYSFYTINGKSWSDGPMPWKGEV